MLRRSAGCDGRRQGGALRPFRDLCKAQKSLFAVIPACAGMTKSNISDGLKRFRRDRVRIPLVGLLRLLSAAWLFCCIFYGFDMVVK